MSRQRKRARLLLGLMSGTSADGIDVALVRIADATDEAPPRARLQAFATLPFPNKVRAEVLRIAEGTPVSTGEISQLNFRLGQVFAQTLLAACKKFGVAPQRISLIGSHGQTVFHQGKASSFLGAPVSSTLQIGEPAVIAAETGILTVGDFRPADMAAGGQGAPLVPWVDYLLYRDARQGRAALNIGGIANVTVIPPAARPEDVFAFDTGPGNMIIDGLVRHFTRGESSFDRDAQMAVRGRLRPELLKSLLGGALDDRYFRRPPPKTAGREQYGKAAVAHIVRWGRQHRAKPEDLVSTATVFTAISIADAFHRFVLPRADVTQLIVSGGGARNPLLMAQLSAALRGVKILQSDELGVPGDAKEAFAFALLANETIHGRPANLPAATGATMPAVLGKVCYPPLRQGRKRG